MDKIQFNKLEILKQLEYVNLNLKQGQTLRAIAENIGISKTTIRERLFKIGYTYNATNKLYEKINSEGIQIDHEEVKTQQEKAREVKNHIRDTTKKVSDIVVDRPDHRPIYSLPVKTNIKPQTQAFNIVMAKVLVKRLDYIGKAKGYSRNELINYICNMVIDDLEK